MYWPWRVPMAIWCGGNRCGASIPLGPPSRRSEVIPLLMKKFEENVAKAVHAERRARILEHLSSRSAVERMAVDDMMTLLAL